MVKELGACTMSAGLNLLDSLSGRPFHVLSDEKDHFGHSAAAGFERAGRGFERAQPRSASPLATAACVCMFNAHRSLLSVT